MREYSSLNGTDLLRNIITRISRLERGAVKTRVPEVLEEPTSDEESEGAQLYVYGGQLRVRIGNTSYSVDVTPL